MPEPWAVPAAGKEMDGKAGKGQRSPAWGLCGYKKELARIEGWEAYEEYQENGRPDDMTEDELVASWDQFGKRKEIVLERFMDARYGNTK
ncbi:MAG: hypothetical protein GWO24_31400, partial [Akkermansiaceae bacterium]|nr:hypothetical protein [Akkermansiaceae bacterium]NIT79127.1 hypothetical protein [Thermoplasmata archaeon]NIY05495.1 hypothetical protein [Thermoplasmata archaeon]